MTLRLQTKYKVASNSLDHLYPTGAVNDNSTSLDFIEDVERYFGYRPIDFMDLGCAGGQLVVDFASRGHTAIGLEGSTHPKEKGLFNWPEHGDKLLYTCDISRPFTVEKDAPTFPGIGWDNPKSTLKSGTFFTEKFDLITAWEVLEHLRLCELCTVFENIRNHLHDEGFFVGSINWHKAHSKDNPSIVVHRTRFQKEFWAENIIPDYFDIVDYPFRHAVRGMSDPKAFLIALQLNPRYK